MGDKEYGTNIESILDGVIQDINAGNAPPNEELKMWIFIRKDIAIPAGKLAVQAGHAFGTCLWASSRENPALCEDYMNSAQPKISLVAKNENEVVKAVESCREAGLTAMYVRDAGRTVFEVPTITVGVVGPCLRSDLPKRVFRMRLFEERDLVREVG